MSDSDRQDGMPLLTSASVANCLDQADALRKAQRWAEAKPLYQQVLKQNADQPRALYGLGCCLLAPPEQDPSRLDLARGLLARAAFLRPRHPAFHVALGDALRRLERWNDAAAAYLKAVDLVPSATEPAMLLVGCLGKLQRWADVEKVAGFALSRGADPVSLGCARGWAQDHQGRKDAAEDTYGAVLHDHPSALQAWDGRARLRLQRRALDDALKDARQVVALAPQQARSHVLLATVLRAREDLAGAVLACEQAVNLDPASVDAVAQLATLYDLQKRSSLAEEWFVRALALDPARLDVRYNYACCLMAQARPDEAEQQFRQCTRANPRWCDALTNLAVALLALSRVEEAVEILRHALAISKTPLETAEARYNLAWALLLLAQYEEGWALYDARWDLADFSSPRRSFPVPAWTGEDAPNACVYLHAEQGAGDCIQMLRFVPLVRQRVSRVILEVPSSLHALAASVAGADRVVIADLSRPDHLSGNADFHAPLMSLPHLLGISVDTVPATVPYVAASAAATASVPAAVRAWANQHQGQRLRVGLVWAGAAANKIDRFRSLPQDRLSFLLDKLESVDTVALASLQVGPRADERGGRLFELLNGVTSFDDTAARLSLLDLIIGVDTAVIHLAGALAIPCWMMIPSAPDYRWHAQGECSPWYPTLRLFRQSHRGEWGDVIDRLHVALKSLSYHSSE